MANDPDNERFKNPGDTESKFIQETGFTTQTNYSYLYQTFHALMGTETEQAKHDDVTALIEKLVYGWNGADGFLFSGPADNVLNSHLAMGNHDKPRVLHGFCLDNDIFHGKLSDGHVMNEMRKFYAGDSQKLYDVDRMKELNDELDNSQPGSLSYQQKREELKELEKQYSPKALAMGKAIDESIEVVEMPVAAKNALKAAIRDLTTGENAEYFGVRPIDHNVEDVFNRAKEICPEFDQLIKDEKKLKNAIQDEFLKPGMEKYKAALSMLVCMPGNVTHYAGDELGETGFETKCKNVYLQNRNPLHWERVDSSSDNYRPIIDEYKEEIARIYNLRNDEKLSPLVNGATVVLSPVKGTSENRNEVNIVPVYRYNEERDVIALFNNAGFGVKRADKSVPVKVFSINLTRELEPVVKSNGQKAANDKTYAITNQIPDGTEYLNANTKDDTVYVVRGGKLERKDGKPIEMDSPALILYRKETFNESRKPKNVSFQGKTLNPNVTLANLKYNLPAHRTGFVGIKQVNSERADKITLSV